MAYINGQKILFSPRIQITGNGAGGDAIVSVASLPTENISTNHFYRTSDGVYWYDGENWHELDYGLSAELDEIREETDILFEMTNDFNADIAALMNRVTNLKEKVITTTGTGKAYEATVPSITELVAGVSFLMNPHTQSSSTSVTLNVNGSGAKVLYRYGGDGKGAFELPRANFLSLNKVYRVFYDGSFWILADYAKPKATDLYGVVPVENGGLPTTSVGNVGKVLTTNEEGTPEWQTPSASGGTTDIVVPDISTSQRGTAGLVYLYNDSSGLALNEDKRLCVSPASQNEITEGVSARKPITPRTMKYAMRENSFTGDLANILSTSTDAKTPVGAFAVKELVLKNALNFKFDKIPRGKTFTITPGMIALILPYGDYTLSAHKSDNTTIASSMGATIVMATDWGADYDNANNYWVAFMHVKKASLMPTMASNHNSYTSNCYIKNNDTGTSGTGYAYVYYLTR